MKRCSMQRHRAAFSDGCGINLSFRISRGTKLFLKDYLGNHPNVGDIRGRGLFWGIEFVKEKASKEPFDSNIAYDIRDSFLSPPFNMTVYAGVGFVDGKRGDHIILAPPFTVKKKEVELIVTTVLAAVNCFFLNPPS